MRSTRWCFRNRRKLFMMICLMQCFLIVLFPRIIHETQFRIDKATHDYKTFHQVLKAVLGFITETIDAWGHDYSKIKFLNTSKFIELAQKQDFNGLARACVDGIHQLYPVHMHNFFYHGIKDPWQIWVIVMMQCSSGIVDCSDPRYDFFSVSWRNTHVWRSLSGSDDVLWASVMLGSNPNFVDLDYKLNGARGAKQLYDEVVDHYIHREGNHTHVYWNIARKYTATISINLFVASSVQLYRQFKDPIYLENALSALGALLNPESYPIITKDGHVLDGKNLQMEIDRTEWSYNSGVALRAISLLYETTQDEKYYILAENIAKTAVQIFWKNGHMAEVDKSEINGDQRLFKGILLNYLGHFLKIVAKKNDRKFPSWVFSLKKKLVAESIWLVNNRLTERGFCVYWGEHYAEENCKKNVVFTYDVRGMSTAAQLFALTDLLKKLVPE